MAVRLTNRQMGIPNGYRFYVPQTKWTPRPGSSFQGIVEALYRHLEGNPHVLKQLAWPLDMNFLAERVDEFNAALCEKMGWRAYITEGTAAGGAARSPFPPGAERTSPTLQSVHRPSPLQLARRSVAGAASLVEWIKDGGEAVPLDQAQGRAATCAGCPLNEKTDLLSVFTVPASEAIRAELSKRSAWGLKTDLDDQLGICSACSCPLKLMVHVPLEAKLKHMPAESKSALWENCWVRKEESQPQLT